MSSRVQVASPVLYSPGMHHLAVINQIQVPEGMEDEAESVRNTYVAYFQRQPGFVSSTFYRASSREANGWIRYINVVVWDSRKSYERVVNRGFETELGENRDGMRVLGRGFPEPIVVSPGVFDLVAYDTATEQR